MCLGLKFADIDLQKFLTNAPDRVAVLIFSEQVVCFFYLIFRFVCRLGLFVDEVIIITLHRSCDVQLECTWIRCSLGIGFVLINIIFRLPNVLEIGTVGSIVLWE